MKGLVHIYCGNGKGKTTASMGLSIRMAGRGGKVVIVQFLKDTQTGELEILKNIPNIQVIRNQEHLGFTFRMSEEQKKHAAQIQQELFAQAVQASKTCDLLVLDEMMAAINTGMISCQQVEQLIQEKPEHLELVMTGRNPPESLIQLADYVSEINKVKHPFDQGIPARIGVER